jgi:cell division protein FtsB
MKQQNLRKTYYHLKHDLFTTNNIVVVIALFIAISWAWGSVGVLERNYSLQREIYSKERQLQLVRLETATLKYQNKYYQSDEYKELEVRKRLGLVLPGEKVLIMPANSKAASASGEAEESIPPQLVIKQSNLEQWINFLFGGNASSLQ